MSNILELVKFDKNGLVPAIAQDIRTDEVLMLAYMNEESLKKTIETGTVHYFSRSRQRLWLKGETSGHFQRVRSISVDCDGDTLLLKVEQTGAACHTGHRSCFFTRLDADELRGDTKPDDNCRECVESPKEEERAEAGENSEAEADLIRGHEVLEEVFDVIADRMKNPKEGSYTNYLFTKGIDKILKKVGEEACEVVIASKNGGKDEIKAEIADLLYHLMVLLVQSGMTLDDVYKELEQRK